jgi:CRP/FNR family cyclic AMP-dependent transcriptional regulator
VERPFHFLSPGFGNDRIATVTTLMESVIVRLEQAAIIRMIQEPAFFASSWLNSPRRSRPCRSAVQFERKASCRLLLLLADLGKEGKPG